MISDFDFVNFRIVNKVKKGKGGRKDEPFRITKSLLIDLKEYIGDRKGGWLFLNKLGD